MRISTGTIYERGVASMQDNQVNLLKTQQQISTGRRVLTPADDPISATRTLEVSQQKSINEQYATNIKLARNSLELEESVLTQVGDAVQDIRQLLVAAGNGSYDDANRQALALDLRGRYEQLLGLANSQDGSQFVFSGFQGDTQPFGLSGGTVQYFGDQGRRLVQVGSRRQIAVSDSGEDVFVRNRTGNGTFIAQADAGNTGTGVIGPGSVADPTALTGNDYAISFSVVAGVTTYQVDNLTTGTTLSTGNAYTPGMTITVDGMQVDLRGDPADGDRFTLTPSTTQSVFKTLEDAISALETMITTPNAQATLENRLNVALSNLDGVLENTLRVRADVGARMKEVDALANTGDDLGLQYDQVLSELQDLDYAKAISDLSLQRVYLEAAQRSFLSVTGSSLFDFV